ncbi:MAG: glycerate kinase type-2 family protein [Gammaproteobacteria bacterium]
MRNDIHVGADLDFPGARTLLEAFRTAVAAASPARCLLPDSVPRGDLLVLGAGKAAAAMAVAVNRHATGSVRGFVVTRYGHGLQPGEDAGQIEVVESGHPHPDEKSAAAGSQLLNLAATLHDGETLLFLASGGASSLAAAPLADVTLEQKRAIADFLMRDGADIRDINCVRRHLSAIKGGRLARIAHPCRVVTLAISDVPGDAIGDIGSGPTIADPTTGAEALEILERHRVPDTADLSVQLLDPRYESPKPGDADFAADRAEIVATGKTALDEADEYLSALGVPVRRLGEDLTDEAHELGREHARLAQEAVEAREPLAILSGGETRVKVRSRGGRGGRNLEYLAGLAIGLNGLDDVVALAADTDGIDGSGGHAGAIVTPEILGIGREAGLDIQTQLNKNDTYLFFQACKLLVETGPTRTNVNDFRLILINPTAVEPALG